MKFVDTNILVRLITNDIPEQSQQAEIWIQAEPTGNILIPDSVLTELFFILSRHKEYLMSQRQISGALNDLISAPQLVLEIGASEALEIAKLNPKLDFTDCVLLVKSNYEKNNLLTFDKDLLAAAK